MNNTQFIIIVVAITVVIIVLLIYFIHILVVSPIVSSAVSSALSTYQQEFQQCAEQYANAFNTFIKESPEGFNQAELQTLAQLQQCMNSAAQGMANVAKSLGQNPLNIIAQGVEAALIAVGIAYGIVKIIKALKTFTSGGANNGGAAANILSNAIIRYDLENGIITPDQAAGVINSLNNVYNLNVSAVYSFANYLVQINVLTIDQVSQFESSETNLMYDDTIDTEALLAPS
jgi:hypothetical protein